MVLDAGGEHRFSGSAATLSFAGHSHRGSVRQANEDSFLASPPVFVVADGMGGHARGDLASRAAVAAFASAFPSGECATPEQVLEAIRRSNGDVLEVSAGTKTVSGTTLAGVAFVRTGPDDSGRWMVFNIGDSRVYSWDGRTLRQLTVDHSAVQELVEAGQITRAQADAHPARNIVTKALGASAAVDPDVWLLPAGGHQTFLVCSDGLTKELSDEEITRIMVFHGSVAPNDTSQLPLSLAERLVKAAVAAGGRDNVTVVLAECQFAGTDDLAGDTMERNAMPSYLDETLPRGLT